MPHFLLELRPSRPDLPATSTPEEQALVGAHFDRLQRLTREGVVLMAGRSEDAQIGVVLLDVPDEATARRIVEEDPALATGLMVPKLHAFRLALWEPRDGGPGPKGSQER